MTACALVHFNHQLNNGLISWPDFRTSSWKPNYGDMLVCAALIRQIGYYDDFIRIDFGYRLPRKADCAVIRGSTYLHNEFNFDAAIETLDSLPESNIAMVGLGAQNPIQDLSFLDNNKSAHIFLKKLSERSASISVRGNFTSAILERHGIKNIRITGCPSLFYTHKPPSVKVPELLSTRNRRLGVSLHTGLSQNIFCKSPRKTQALHGTVIDYCSKNASSVALYEQGIQLEFAVADRTLPFQERIEAAKQIIARIDAEGMISPEQLISQMVSVHNIEEWLAKARDQDAMLGFRFHGNMVGLLQGSPCLYYVYDSRLEEFCRLYGLPYVDVESQWTDPIKVILDWDWDRANANIKGCYQELKAFYDENGVKNTLN